MLLLTAAMGFVYKHYFRPGEGLAHDAWRFDVSAGLVVLLYTMLAFHLPLRSREVQALVTMMAAMILSRYFAHRLGMLIVHAEPNGWLFDPHSRRDVMVFYWLIGSPIILLTLPMVVLLLWRQSPGRYGLAAGEWRAWLKWLGFSVIAMAPVLWFGITKLPTMLGSHGGARLDQFYPLIIGARQTWVTFAAFQGLIAVLMFAWEFSLRGFLQFALVPRLGWLAIVVQCMPFVLGHVNKPEAELYGTLVSGLFLGYVAYRGRSMVPAFLIHLIVAAMNDLLVILSTGGFGGSFG